jgi:hypothetical protein
MARACFEGFMAATCQPPSSCLSSDAAAAPDDTGGTLCTRQAALPLLMKAVALFGITKGRANASWINVGIKVFNPAKSQKNR